MQSTIPQQNTTVSIIFSESTASLLKLNVPNLENFVDSNTMVCSIHALYSGNIFLERGNKKKFRDYFFNRRDGRTSIDSDRIQSEIAYISKHACSNSSIDLTDEALLNSKEESEQEREKLALEVVRLYTRPIVCMKTEAHKDNLNAVNNTLYISIMESELSVTQSGWVNVCRICHGGESIENLLSPCRCRGSIALAHLGCLERWLKESASSRCELCHHHFEIIREPKYSIPWSVLVFLRHPGDHYKELLLDMLAFLLYTPSAFASTYMLMLLCESIAKTNLQINKNLSAHIMAFSAIFGIAAIDFTYSSWLIVTVQKHTEAWKSWYRNNCQLKLILPKWKIKRQQRKRKLGHDNDVD